MSEDEKYLRDLGYPQDAWVLSGQQWYTAVEVGKYLGISDDAARKLAEGGRVPGAILHDRRIGWRFPREGMIAYIAEQRRRTEQRQRDTTA